MQGRKQLSLPLSEPKVPAAGQDEGCVIEKGSKMSHSLE